MAYGHSPDAVDEMPWRDVEGFLLALPYIDPRFGGF